MQGRPFAKMGIGFAASRFVLTILLAAAAVSLLSEPLLVTLLRPWKIKVAHGEIVLQPRTKLQVLSIDHPATPGTVQVLWTGEVLTIPRDIVQLESGPTEQPTATASPIPSASSSPPPPARPPVQQPTPSLGWGWDSPMQGGDITMRELQSLLSPHCTPAVDLSGSGINIYNGVRYLMDLDEAASVLGVRGHIPS
jgi:hypothetical protein